MAAVKTGMFRMTGSLKKKQVNDEQAGSNIVPSHLLRWQHVDDEELMVCAQRDNQEAFEMLIRRHQKLLLRSAARYLGNTVLAQDIVQEVFLSLWKNRSQYQTLGKFRSYLITLTLNRCRDIKRKNQTKENYSRNDGSESQNIPDESALPDQRLDHSERTAFVHNLLARLEERIKEVLILRYIQGLPLNEIAQTTGMPLGTVKSHLSRGVMQLYEMAKRSMA